MNSLVQWLLHAQHQERVVRGREALLRNGLQQGSSRPRDIQARNKVKRITKKKKKEKENRRRGSVFFPE